VRVTWLEDAWQNVQDADPAIRGRIESEVPVMFMDSVPATAVSHSGGVLMVELPCGVEIDFERTGDGVRILYVAF
jgi:hypothetical protein